jgi:hypothetical protein
MANASTTGFGLKPIKMYGNGYESMGLGEYPVAASSDAIYFQDAVCQAATGYVIVGIATTTDIIGSLNGVSTLMLLHRSQRSKTTYKVVMPQLIS